VNGSIAVGGPLITQLHSSTTTGGALVASTAATDAATAIAAMEQRVGRALAANSSGDALIRTSFTGIRHI
jgi:hypothetical protein